MNPAWPERGRLRLAVLAALTATTVALAVRILLSDPARVPQPGELVLLLIATAALCVAGLARRRHLSAVWLGCVVAATFAYLDLVAAVRTGMVAPDPSSLGWSMGVTGLAGIASVAIAGGYATARSRSLGRWVGGIAVFGVALVVLTASVVVATTGVGSSPLVDARNAVGLMTRTTLLAVLTITAVGILGDLRPAVRRASLRLEVEAVDRPPTWGRRAAVLADEVAPGRRRAERAAAEERTRIAADLHAHVVPPVRHALEAAERGGSPEDLVATLRTVLADVDAMTAERHSVTLEALGLVAALEQLAERIEDRSDVRISIDIMAGPASPLLSDTEQRPPRDVERAAFRIGQLALDNVVRHAPSATVRIEVVATSGAVRLAIVDDGPGLTADREAWASAAGRRGLADMRMAAEQCHGSLAVGDDKGAGAGASIRFSWPAEASVAPARSGVSPNPREGTSAIPS